MTDADFSSIDAAQPEASTTLEQADSHALICSKLAEQHKSDPVLFAALTDAAAIIRDLMRDRLGASATGAGQAEIEALRETLATLKAENEMLRKVLKEADNELDWLDEDVDTCDHSVGVCDYWDMRRKMKAALASQRGNADIALLVFAVVCAVWLVIAGAMGWLPGGGL